MANTIYLENGVRHELTTEEIEILRGVLEDMEVDAAIPLRRYVKKPDKYDAALESLKSLFIEHLD